MYPRAYGEYVLLERLGAGGMSEIDLARKALEEASYVRFLVIKRIKADRHDDPSFVRMFKDEARITAELHHGNIAQTYDFGKLNDEYYLVLEYVPGVDARQIINVYRDREAPIPLRVVLRVICDVLEGLQYAHTKLDTFGRPMRIVHRDVNPRNIMVSTRGEVKLIDFGVAKATGRLERTRTDHVKGKFAYMAPEQVSGGEIDHRADLFAVALTLHEMVAGFGPFYGLNHVQIMHRLMSGSVPELPSHPDLPDITPLRRVQKKALATRVEDRYADCDAYRKDLERVAERIGGLASRQEIARLVAEVQPGIEDNLRKKMQAFAGPLEYEGSQELQGAPAPKLPPPPRLEDVSGPPSGSFTGTGTVTVSRGIAAVGGLAVVGGALALVAALALAVVVLIWAGDLRFATTADAKLPDDAPVVGVIVPDPGAVAPSDDPVAVTPPEPPDDGTAEPTTTDAPATAKTPEPKASTPTKPPKEPVPEAAGTADPPAVDGGTASEAVSEPAPVVEVAPTSTEVPEPPAARCTKADRTASVMIKAPAGAAVSIAGEAFNVGDGVLNTAYCAGAHELVVDGFPPVKVQLSNAAATRVVCGSGTCKVL